MSGGLYKSHNMTLHCSAHSKAAEFRLRGHLQLPWKTKRQTIISLTMLTQLCFSPQIPQSEILTLSFGFKVLSTNMIHMCSTIKRSAAAWIRGTMYDSENWKDFSPKWAKTFLTHCAHLIMFQSPVRNHGHINGFYNVGQIKWEFFQMGLLFGSVFFTFCLSLF